MYIKNLARFPETVIMLIITPVWPVYYTCMSWCLMVYMLPALFHTRNKLSFKELIFFLKLFKMQKKKKCTALERTQFCCQLKLYLEFSFQIINIAMLSVKFLKE